MIDTAVSNIPAIEGGNEIWIEALPARTFHTPQYGPVEVTQDKLGRMVANFNRRIRGQDISTDFDHGMDRSKGNQASGWFKEFAIKPSTDDPTQASLFARVELTDDARSEIQQKKWRYFSLEWDDSWMDNDGQVHSDVIMGGAFTNRPIAKKTMPINFSEAMWNSLDYETKKEFAVWPTAFVNNLPDSCFMYIQPGGTHDKQGKTVPRTLRHFPYKGSDGKVDLPHLRNAIARIPQAGTWLSESMKSSLQARARKLLGGAGASGTSMSEGDTAVMDALELLTRKGFDVTDPNNEEWVREVIANAKTTPATPNVLTAPTTLTTPITPNNGATLSTTNSTSGVMVLTDTTNGSSTPDVTIVTTTSAPTAESKELEHAEPGTGNPPSPRTDGAGQDELDRTEGWRRPTPPDQTQETGTSSEVRPVTVNINVDSEQITKAVTEAMVNSEGAAVVTGDGDGAVVTTTTETDVGVETETETDNDDDDTKGGQSSMTTEEEFELRQILGAGASGDMVEAAKIQLGELQTLRQSQDAATQERRFAEEYPAFWTEHNKLMDRDRDSTARQFSESVARVRRAEGFGLKETAKGLSSMALTKIKELHKEFSEGTASLDKFEDCIRTIVNGGIVDFGEIGTSSTEDMPLIDTSTAPGIAGARKAFGEVTSRLQRENPDWDYRRCMEEAARKHPDLAEAYAITLPA